MPKFTKEMILVIHEDLIQFGGKAHGILYEATIDYILSKIEAARGVFEKAAWALYMSRQHPFIDGNKRTSFALAATILNINGYYLSKQDEDEIFIALHKISDASISCDIKQIEEWLKRKSRRWQRNYGGQDRSISGPIAPEDCDGTL